MLNKGEFLTTAGFFVVGLLIVLRALSFSIWAESGLMGLGPQEGFFPLIAGSIMVTLTLFNLIRIWRLSSAQKDVREQQSAIEKDSQPNFFRVFLYVICMVLFGVFLTRAGFLISSAALILVITKLVENQSWRTAILLTLTLMVLSYFLFVFFLRVPLPRGLLK